VDDAIFAAVHEQRLPLRDERSIADWLRMQNVDTNRFSDAFNSFTVKTRMTQSEQMVVRYAVARVPQVVVDGRFIAHGRTHEELLGIADQLIAKARAERSRH
jgi:protein dithiol oxidoreductase (disulfide-forming)